jgi:hypothetical protein
MGTSEEHIGNQGQMKKNPFPTQTSKEKKQGTLSAFPLAA